MHKALLLLLSCCSAVLAQHDITAYGAIPGVDTEAVALVNGHAFAAAVVAANASASGNRTVLVPPGTFAYLPATSTLGVVNLSVFIEGELSLFDGNMTHYPGWPNPWVPLSFHGASNLSIVSATGRGLVNGRGRVWWWHAILIRDIRPNLFEASGSDISLQGVTFLNSPAWHVWLSPVARATVYNCTVRVDIDDQLAALRYIGGTYSTGVADVLAAARLIPPASAAAAKALADSPSLTDASSATLAAARAAALPADIRALPWFDPAWSITPPVPMVWALNTDGFDFAGVNVTVANCSVTNFDDSVCVKPSGGSPPTGCTRGARISDITITYGVGVSMGSVPPDVGGNCIDDVQAVRLSFDTPLKALYVKPNPAKGGGATGAITNILSEDVTIRNTLWWPIWVGTQQQHQPGGGADTGCSFFFPLFNTTCPTDPEVTLANFTFRRVAIHGGLLSPGVLIANVSNPGTGFLFDGVVVHNSSGWPVSGGYLVQSVAGIATGGTSPVPPGFVVQ
jgi:hypothetical protein